MLVGFDQHYQIRDLYYPHVGQENHVGGGPCRFGVWSILPKRPDQTERRRRRLFWSYQGWEIHLGYEADTLATRVTMRHAQLDLELRCCDVVDFHRPLLVRRIEVHNGVDTRRAVHLFHHQDFNLFGTKVGDTACFDPQLNALAHYRCDRYLLACFCDANGRQRLDGYATGLAGFQGAEGTWRDAEDGDLGGNPIAQGSVDSTIMIRLTLPPCGSRVAYLVLGAGQSHADLLALRRFLAREGPRGVIERTRAYWRLWLNAGRTRFPDPLEGGPTSKVVELFKRSLLVLRSQIDNDGAIVAANDSDVMQYSRDTYSYLWPRDGALVAAALDATGFPDLARRFYSLCARLIGEAGYFLHKYNPDGTPASSWHPWLSDGRPQLPIQEDETALVVWALRRHFERYQDLEFVRPLWSSLVIPAADFLVRFRDPATDLPLPSYDLWEERFGVHAFTVATVHAALEAAHRFAGGFGDARRSETYGQVADRLRRAFCRHFWCPAEQRFLRRLVPRDRDRTGRMLAAIIAGRTPSSKAVGPAPDSASTADLFELDAVVDSSLYAIYAMGLLDVHDERVEHTMRAVEGALWVKSPIGGVARYQGDGYHRVSDDVRHVPGNPWFICTLWLAEWKIARARTIDDLTEALPFLEWVAARTLPSGVLAEQVHPDTNAPLSVSPLTWSHAAFVSAVEAYASRLEDMTACKTCGQPRQCLIPRRQRGGRGSGEATKGAGDAGPDGGAGQRTPRAVE